MTDKKKARAYIIDDHHGKRYGPERNVTETAKLENDIKILESHAIGNFRTSGIELETDDHYNSEERIPTDSAYATQIKMEKEAQAKAKAKAEAEAKKRRRREQQRERERWGRERERITREQGGNNARDHDVDRGRGRNIG